MPEYVLNRNHLLRTTMGHMIDFKKGEPVYVPPLIERDAVAIGAERVDGKRIDMLDPEKSAEIELSPEDRLEQINAAFELLVERNDAKDFTAAGAPTVGAVKKIVEFDVDRGEIVEAWNAFRTKGE